VSYRYRLYGLTLFSDECLPALEPFSEDSGPADVRLELRSVPDWVRLARTLRSHRVHQLEAIPQANDPALVVTSCGEGFFWSLSYSDGTEFMTDAAARRLWGRWKQPCTKEDFATYLLGPIMGFVLRCKGVTPLHASAVCIGGNAILFCGAAQTGKSTTAAALGLRGWPVLCEDIAALKLRDNHYWVEPGYPRVCLWPDSVERLMGRSDAFPLLTPNWEKRYLPLDGVRASFERERRSLEAIYLLAPGTEGNALPHVEKLTPKQALLELLPHTYLNWLPDREHRTREFEMLTHLVERVPIRKITKHFQPGQMDALCEGIIADMGERSGCRVATWERNPP
jgi:hypothetical protein